MRTTIARMLAAAVACTALATVTACGAGEINADPAVVPGATSWMRRGLASHRASSAGSPSALPVNDFAKLWQQLRPFGVTDGREANPSRPQGPTP